MKRTGNLALVSLFFLLMLPACGTSVLGGGSSGSGGSSGTSTTGGSTSSSSSGNAAGVVGSWYVFSDGFGADGKAADGDCVMRGLFPVADCSIVTSPTPGAGASPPSAGSSMCLMGTAAQVINGPAGGPSPGMPDYSDLFGMGIGVDLNDPGGDGGAGAQPFDASNYAGITFDAIFPDPTNAPQMNMRVQFPTSETSSSGDSAYWGGAITSGSPVVSGANSIPWSEVGGPSFVTNPPLFDVTKILAIQFAVYTDTAATVPVSFCISNLTLAQ